LARSNWQKGISPVFLLLFDDIPGTATNLPWFEIPFIGIVIPHIYIGNTDAILALEVPFEIWETIIIFLACPEPRAKSRCRAVARVPLKYLIFYT
jgi:hypothetical protein